MNKYAIYARVSTLEESQETSYEIQQTELKTRAEALYPKEELYKIYGDQGISGSKEERPGFQAMVADAETGKFQRIITKSISRFARNTRILLSYLERLEKAGVSVLFLEENIDTEKGNSKFLLTILGAVAEMERENTQSHIRESYELRRAAGKPAHPFATPYGYKRENGVTEVDPEKAKIVKRIFKLYVEENMAASRIARILNNEGVSVPRPHASKKPTRPVWSRKTVNDILDRKAYMGTLAEKTPTGVKEFPGTIPAIVPASLWEHAHSLRVARGSTPKAIKLRENNQNFKPQLYPLSGITYCVCGMRCTRQTRTTTSEVPLLYTDPASGLPMWGCLSRVVSTQVPSCKTYYIGESVLYQMIIEAIAYAYSQAGPEIITNDAWLTVAQDEEYDQKLAAYEARKKELEDALDRAVSLFTEGLISKEIVEPRIRSINNELGKLIKPEPPEAIQANLEALDNFFGIQWDISIKTAEKYPLMKAELEKVFTSNEARRNITRGLVSKVVIGAGPTWTAVVTLAELGEVTLHSDRRNPDRRGGILKNPKIEVVKYERIYK